VEELPEGPALHADLEDVVAVPRLGVLLPHRGRLADVSVGIDDEAFARSHGVAPDDLPASIDPESPPEKEVTLAPRRRSHAVLAT